MRIVRDWVICLSIGLGAIVIACESSASPPVSFTAVPLIPGTGANDALSISADGTTVVGWAAPIPFGNHETAFRWIVGQAPEMIGALGTPGLHTTATGVSADGSVVVGTRSTGNAFRWTASGGFQDIPAPPGAAASDHPLGISADGNAVAGLANVGITPRAYYWSASGGTTLIPLPDPRLTSNEGYARGLSGDGQHVLGDSATNSGHTGYIWSPSTGFEHTGLGIPPGASYVFGSSVDGSVIVGRSDSPSGVAIQGWTWSASGGYSVLPDLPGTTTLNPTAISGDGHTIVGGSAASMFTDPFFWTSQTGTVSLRSYLVLNGVDLTGWNMGTAYDVSYDGTSIVGVGSFGGQDRGWLVTIPAPSSLILIVVALFPRRRQVVSTIPTKRATRQSASTNRLGGCM